MSEQKPVVVLVHGAFAESASWNGVISDQDLNIPVELHRFFAERAGSRGTREVQGASHALSVSQPGAVAASILEALAGAVTGPEAVLS